MIREEVLIDKVEAEWVDATPGDPDAVPPEDPQPGRYVINVRRATRVLRGDTVIAKELHRHVVELHATDDKGERVPVDLSDQDPIVQKIAGAVLDQVAEVAATVEAIPKP